MPTGARLGRVGLGLGQPGTAEIGYWTDPRVRHCGVATSAVRAACHWAFTTLGTELIGWRCEVGNTWVGSMLSTEVTSMPR